MAYGKNAYKGRWKPTNIAKYNGDVNNITYRSSWELKFMNWLDSRSNVISWNSEETIIPYMSPVDGKPHRYFVDFKFQVRSPEGIITTYLAEVKPKKYTVPPIQPKRKSKAYIEEVHMWVVNNAKWIAAREYCADRAYKFVIVTEVELGIKR
jgi:hypothetical protein